MRELRESISMVCRSEMALNDFPQDSGKALHHHSAGQWPRPRPAVLPLGHLFSLCSYKAEGGFWWPWERYASPGRAVEPPYFFQAKFLPSLSCNIVTAYERFGTQAVPLQTIPQGMQGCVHWHTPLLVTSNLCLAQVGRSQEVIVALLIQRRQHVFTREISVFIFHSQKQAENGEMIFPVS